MHIHFSCKCTEYCYGGESLMPTIPLKYMKSAFSLLNQRVDRTSLVCKINLRPIYLPTAKKKEIYEIFFRLISC